MYFRKFQIFEIKSFKKQLYKVNGVLRQQAAREVVDGIPHRQEAYGQYGEEDDDDIPGVNADGIGVDDERALAAA